LVPALYFSGVIAVGVYGVGGNGIPNISDGVDVFGDCSADSGGDAYGDGPNNDCRDGVAGNEVGGDVSDIVDEMDAQRAARVGYTRLCEFDVGEKAGGSKLCNALWQPSSLFVLWLLKYKK